MTEGKRRLMNVGEIAQALGVDGSTVSQWRARYSDPPFPAPDEEVSTGSRTFPLWDASRLPEIKAWRRQMVRPKRRTS